MICPILRPVGPERDLALTDLGKRKRGCARNRSRVQGSWSNLAQQNLFFAFVYNALGVANAAGVLYPFFGFALESNGRCCRDELQFGFGGRECAAAAEQTSLNHQTILIPVPVVRIHSPGPFH